MELPEKFCVHGEISGILYCRCLGLNSKKGAALVEHKKGSLERPTYFTPASMVTDPKAFTLGIMIGAAGVKLWPRAAVGEEWVIESCRTPTLQKNLLRWCTPYVNWSGR